MSDPGHRISEGSPTYDEFSRLYDLARQLRPTGVDRWNRELYATRGAGGFDQQTGAIGIREPLLREGLTSHPTENPRRQARALAAVLNRVTQAGMDLDAPGEANAIRTAQSRGLHDGVASVRAANDFDAFRSAAGYPRLAFDNTQRSGTYAATNDLIQQVSGPNVDRLDLINRLSNGPAMMHFDQLAEAVVQNRLQEIAPPEGADRRALRYELMTTMLRPQWESLAQRSPEAGQHVAGEIGRALNAKVDEIRQRHQRTGRVVGSDGALQRDAERAHEPTAHQPGQKAEEVPAARFLSGVAPPTGGRTPSLGDGSRAAAARASAPVRGASTPGLHVPNER